MSEFVKSDMIVDGETVRMSMPFAKVDKAKRLVSGYATLDNIDTQGDIVLAEASYAAFSNARGNIREMHQPLAVGKMVDFREDEFFDKDDNKLYRGIYVTARVSEGAEDTWKKVLDGTLTGFSIGGEITEVSNEFVKDAGKTVRFIKGYNLVELSLVDNPANQKANFDRVEKNVFSISENAEGSVMLKGMVADTEIENVFICPKDSHVSVNKSESSSCPDCGTLMENAGWFESAGDRAEKVSSIVTKFLAPIEKGATPNSESEGGVEVANETPVPEGKETSVVNPSEEFQVDGSKLEEEAKPTDVSEVETPVEAEEPEAEESDEISKKIDALHNAVKESLNEGRTETLEKLNALEEKINEATTSFLEKTTELESKMGEVGEKLEASKSRLSDLEARLEKFNNADAVKKSAGVSSTPVVPKQKNEFWGGAFS